MDGHDATGPPARPLLRVVRGDATPEEIAALVALLGARQPAAPPAAPTRSAWSDRAATMRPATATGPGPGSWARSGRVPGARTRADW